MALSNKDLSTLRQAFVSQYEVGANTTYPIYRSPQNKTSYVKKLIVTNNTSSSATFDIGLYENQYMVGNNVFIAVSNLSSTNAAYSTDGIAWALTTLPVALDWYAPTYGNGIFIAVGAGSTTSAYSTNGITWTATTLPTSASMRGAAYGNGIFVATSWSSFAAAYSTNGITWTATTIPRTLQQVIYGNGVFVGTDVNFNVTTSVATSTNGITWTIRTLPKSAYFMQALAYGNGILVLAANGEAAATSTSAFTSTDGITWILRTLPSAQYWQGMAYGNNIFFAIASAVTTAASSTDGITWNTRTLPATNFRGITYGNGLFVATGTSNSTTAASSTDGITWTLRTMPVASYWAFPTYPQNSDFSNNTYLQKSITISANSTQVISYEIIVPPTHEIRARSTGPLQISVFGEK